MEKYLISKDSKFFKDTKFIEERLNQNNLNKPYHIAQLKSLDPNIFNCCNKHRMYIQLIKESNESLVEGVVFNSSGVIGHIIHEMKYKEVMLLTDVSHSLPIKTYLRIFLQRKRKWNGRLCNLQFNPLVLNKEIKIGQNF